MTLMFSYGSNMHREQMARRCPAAVPIGWVKLEGWRLVFRGVADCIPEEGSVCWGVIWRITPACERALDLYEGVAGGLYDKTYIPIKRTKAGETEMLVYTMRSTGVMPPSQYYFGVIKQGYRDFRLPPHAHKTLNQALRDSWDEKAPTFRERQRHMRKGRPALALRPVDPKSRKVTEIAAMPRTAQEIIVAE